MQSLETILSCYGTCSYIILLFSCFDTDSSARSSRGNQFAIAFTSRNLIPDLSVPSSHELHNRITLFITTEQNRTNFTIETLFSGVLDHRFSDDLSPGLYSYTATAVKGQFTEIELSSWMIGEPGIAVQNNGQFNESDRNKGILITADDGHELTVYALKTVTFEAYLFGTPVTITNSDSLMALNCVHYPLVRSYQYFVYSSDYSRSDYYRSEVLFTPCEDNTTVSVTPSQTFSHPEWVNPSHATTDPASTSGRDVAHYGRAFNRFDTLLLTSIDDLTGSIIISDKPLSVFSGHLCTAAYNEAICGVSIMQQIPPHLTYGDHYFLIHIFLNGQTMYKIGSVTDGAQVSINCNCSADSGDGGRSVTLHDSGQSLFTATLNRGQYAQCHLPVQQTELPSLCFVESSRPVSVMLFELFFQIIVPPIFSYLNTYTVFSSPWINGQLNYVALKHERNGNHNEVLIEGAQSVQVQTSLMSQCINEQLCASRYIMQFDPGESVILRSNSPFWGISQPGTVYPLSFKMEPLGCKCTPSTITVSNYIVYCI